MQKILKIKNKAKNNEWEVELTFQRLFEMVCNGCEKSKVINLASRNITADTETKYYCYDCANNNINALQSPEFEFITSDPATYNKEFMLNMLFQGLAELEANKNVVEINNDIKENLKETPQENITPIQNTTSEKNEPITKEETQENAINEKPTELEKLQTAQPQEQSEQTMNNQSDRTEEEGKGSEGDEKVQQVSQQQTRSQEEIEKEEWNKSQEFIKQQVEEIKRCSNCGEDITPINRYVNSIDLKGCEACNIVQTNPKPKEEIKEISCSNPKCRKTINEDNQKVQAISKAGNKVGRCQICVKKEGLKLAETDENEILAFVENEKNEDEVKEDEGYQSEIVVNDTENIDSIQAEINRLLELKRQKELETQKKNNPKSSTNEELIKSEIFECGTWQDLCQKERLHKLLGKVRMVFLDPPYGIAYKGFEYEKLADGKDWVVNGVDFSFLPRAAEFLTSDGIIVMWNTLKNCLDLKEYIKKNKPSWKPAILYWVKPVFTTFGLNPIKNHLVVEAVITIGMNKTHVNNWYHGTIFSHPSKRSLDGIKKYLFNKGFTIFDENLANEEFQSATRIYSHNEETGNPYARWTRDTDKGKKEAMTGIAWKPLTLYTEIVNLYIKSTRPLNSDDYIIDLFSGASSGSSYIISRFFNTKFWGSEYDKTTYEYLAGYLVEFMDKFTANDTDYSFIHSLLENNCMCIDYKPIGDKRRRITREEELEAKVKELELREKKIIQEGVKKIAKIEENKLKKIVNEKRIIDTFNEVVNKLTKLQTEIEILKNNGNTTE